MASEKRRYRQRQKPKEAIGCYKEERSALLDELANSEKEELVRIMDVAYEVKTAQQRRTVFGKRLDKLRIKAFPGESLLREIEKFRDDSSNGNYYAPFDIDSRNFTFIPPETEEWFDRLADFFNTAMLLVDQGQYQLAYDAFGLIYELVGLMESGDEIIFADEYGSWMIPVREDDCIAAYLRAVAQMENEDDFTNTAIGLLKRDEKQSFTINVYHSALAAGSPEQVAAFVAKVEKLGLAIQLAR
ncbi:MAG TPA: hypothetical protein VE954_12715 [Oligoflexus sp.]|uniref:hypothetical protein n=1 Tax=Oligoflexus sp. TaxID=1971216 RepID=UPI002D32D12D|nr:hypothetical protein [Oligoflexus sp.]HYX33970.1 hypothetical protein [Oligoflexus sp.]